MKRLVCIFLGFSLASTILADEPAFYRFALTPPMGWNSFDAYGSSVTEEEVLANAKVMRERLASHGYQYVIVDYRWADADARNHACDGVKNNPLVMDEYGRLFPAPNRFPSAAGGEGFKPLADKIHAMGLKFGIHVMRGIPRLAVKANMPIEGSSFHAWDASDFSLCSWCPDMFGIDGKSEAGRSYYQSIFRLYASWGVDFVKVDDLSAPYRADEIAAIRQAIDACGRPMVFSTSPGETPLNRADHITTHANMWRVSRDFWDEWKHLDHTFDLAAAWRAGGPGRWPDYDMIPLGRIGIRCVGGDRWTRFSRDEQVALMSLWALGPSPLMLGMNLPDNDEWTFSLIANDEVLAINQDRLGHPGACVSRVQKAESWVRDLENGAKAVGLFNRGSEETKVTLPWKDAGLSGKWNARDLWRHQDLGLFENEISLTVPAHGGVLLRLTPEGR